MTLRLSLGCALLAILLGACQLKLRLDDRSPDAALSGTGGKTGTGGGSGGGRPTDASVDANCGQAQPIIATGDVPQVVVALDRSSEMVGTQFPGGQNNSQFAAAVSDLSAQVGSYSPSGQHSSRRAISFAYLEFPETASDCNYPGCCSSAALPTSSYQAFTDATMTCSLLGNACGSSNTHPIAAALSRAQTYFQTSTFSVQSEERYVLLVTDDAPDGNCSTENDCQFAQDKVYNLANSWDVTTVIIHVGTGTGDSTSCLQNFAATQGAPPPWYAGNSLYYAAPMQQDLQDAIATAISAIAAGTCRFTLSTTPGSPSQLTVYQGMTPVQPDSKNGWTYDAGNGTPRLVLRGNACTGYLNSQFGLQVFQGCATDHMNNP